MSKKVLPDDYQGPHGVGDPQDMKLRRVERDILIPKLVRDRSRIEKCISEVKEFTECGKDAGLLLTFKCKQQNEKMKECYEKWYKDPGFIEECTQIYLEKRKRYRETGVREPWKRV